MATAKLMPLGSSTVKWEHGPLGDYHVCSLHHLVLLSFHCQWKNSMETKVASLYVHSNASILTFLLIGSAGKEQAMGLGQLRRPFSE